MFCARLDTLGARLTLNNVVVEDNVTQASA
jgi:hypothetical protein